MFLFASLFNSQHVHPHPDVTTTSTIISRPTMTPRAVLVTSQLFILLVSPIQGSTYCVIGWLVHMTSDVVVMIFCVSLMVIIDACRISSSCLNC